MICSDRSFLTLILNCCNRDPDPRTKRNGEYNEFDLVLRHGFILVLSVKLLATQRFVSTSLSPVRTTYLLMCAVSPANECRHFLCDELPIQMVLVVTSSHSCISDYRLLLSVCCTSIKDDTLP